MDYTLLGQSIAKLKHSYTKNGFPNLPHIINNNRMNYIKIIKMIPRIRRYSSVLYISIVEDLKNNSIPKRFMYLLENEQNVSIFDSSRDLNIALKSIINKNISLIFKFYTILCKKDKTFAGFSSEIEMIEFLLTVLNENKEYIYIEFKKLISIKEYKDDINAFKKEICD